MKLSTATLNIYNVCEVACQVYNKALSAENAFSAFRRTGIFPLNKDAFPSEALIPVEFYIRDYNSNKDGDNGFDKMLVMMMVMMLLQFSKTKSQI